MEGSCGVEWRGFLWDLGLQGPQEGRRQRQAQESWQALKTWERIASAQLEGRAGRDPSPSPCICPVLSKHQLIFLTLPEDKEALECHSGQSVKTTAPVTYVA